MSEINTKQIVKKWKKELKLEVDGLKGKGIKYLNKDMYGNLSVTVIAETPKSLSKSDKKALEEMKKSIKPENFARYKDYTKDINSL